MRAPVKTCFRKSAFAVLTSGVVISLSALTGGTAPAFAKPGDHSDPGIPIIPTPEVVAPEAPQQAPPKGAPAEAPRAPKEQPAPPKDEAPPRQLAPAPEIQAPGPAPDPPASQPQAPAPQVQAPLPQPEVPKVVEAPQVDAPAPLPAVEQPAKPGDPKQDAQVPRNLVPGQPPVADEPKSDPSTVTKAAQRIPTAQPDQMQAPEQDIQVAKQSKPVELKPEPAKKDDVDFLSSAINLESKTKLGPLESEFKVGSEFSVGDRDHDRDRDWDWDNKHWDKKVRQWDKRWIEYDDWYRPVFCNPYRAPVRIVYIYERAPRILMVPALGRAVVDAAALSAYSFTAVVLNAANLAADVAVGTFFGGGYLPPIGAPFVPPPPLLRYDNVPVQVRYSDATYQPFRVNQIVDVGDDVQYGGRKVLLDGATPVWGQWTTSPTGERQFEVHRTQQYPGLGEPQEAPLPGDYQMRLASDESADMDRTQMYLIAAAGIVAGLGFGALGLAVYLGRRRRMT